MSLNCGHTRQELHARHRERQARFHPKPVIVRAEPEPPPDLCVVAAETLKQAVAEKGDTPLARQVALVLLAHDYGAAVAAKAMETIEEAVPAAWRVVAPGIAAKAMPIHATRYCFDAVFAEVNQPLPEERRYNLASLSQVVEEAYGVSRMEMTSQRRTEAVARPRQIAMWLARRFTTASFPQIGRAFGGRNHTTVLHACRRMDEIIAFYGLDGGDTPEGWLAAFRSLSLDELRRAAAG